MVSAMKESKWDKIFLGSVYIYLSIALIVVLYPLIYILSASISSPQQVNSGAMWLFPKEITWADTSWSSKPEDLERISEHDRLYWDRNAVEPGRDTACSLCAQQVGFGRSSTVLGIYPVYDVLYRRACANVSRSPEFGADQHDGALILPVAASVWNIIVARTFFQTTIPKELQEAAYMDGCTNLKLFVRIILPLSRRLLQLWLCFTGSVTGTATFRL